MNLAVSLSIGLLASLVWCQQRPPNYSPDRLPETTFTCEDKVSGSYYADVEASCQLFHVCVQVSELEFQDFHFLCPNDTVFDQQHLVCTNWFDVDCQQSLSFFPHDFAFDKGRPEDYHEYTDYKERPDYQEYDYEDINSDPRTFLGFSQPASSGLRGGGRPDNGVSSPGDNQHLDYYDDQDEDARSSSGRPPLQRTPGLGLGHSNPPIATLGPTTPIPLGFTTTRRPPNLSPRVKSNIKQRKKHQRGGSPKFHNRLEEDRNQAGVPSTQKPPPSPFDNPPFISADGRKPRVKANINNQRIVNGNSKSKGKAKKQGSKKVELDRSQFSKIDFVEPSVGQGASIEPTQGPEVRPDGRLPRVKANVRAKESHRAGGAGSPRPQFSPQPTQRPIFKPSPTPGQFQGTPAVPQQQFSSPRPFIPQPTPAVPHTSFTSPRPFFSTPAVPRISPNTPFVPQPTPAVPQSFNPLPPAQRPSRPRPTDQFGPGSAIQQGTREPQGSPRFPARPAPGIRQRFPSPTPTTFQSPSPQSFQSPAQRSFPSSTPRTFQSPTPRTFQSPTPRPFQSPSFPSSTQPIFQSPTPQSFPSPTPRPAFTATPQPAVPSPPQSSNKFSFLTTVPTPQPTSPPRILSSRQPPSFNPPSPSLPRNRNRFGSRPSGRPRVKANQLAQQSQGGGRQKTRPNRFRESPRSQQTKSGGSRRQKIPSGTKFKTIADVNNEIEEEAGKCFNPFHCPPTKTAGGRRPRVKSNIKARKRNFWNPRKSRVIKRRKQVKLNRKLWENVRQGRKQSGGEDASAATLNNRIDTNPVSTTALPLDIRSGAGSGITTTQDPISSLQRLVASKATRGTVAPEIFPPARSFQNKRLQPKQRQRINSRGRGFSRTTPTPANNNEIATRVEPIASPPTEAPRRINTPTGTLAPSRKLPPEVQALIQRFGPPEVEKPRNRPKGRPSFANLGPPPQPKIPPKVAALLKRFGPPRNRPRPAKTTPQPQTNPTLSVFVTNPDFQDTTTASPSQAPLPASAPTQNVPESPFTASDMGLFVTNPRALPDHHKASHNPFSAPPQRSPDGRRPRVKSNIMASLQNRPGPAAAQPAELQPQEQTTQKTVPVLRIKPDGRTPRVKSNQRNMKNHQKKKKAFRNLRKHFQRDRSGRSHHTEPDESNSVSDSESDESDDYVEPELRPDGKKPRIKSNLRAKQSSKGNSQSGKQKKKSGFRHSKRVHQHSLEATTPLAGPEDNADETDIAITTFRPVISLEEFNPDATNETLPVPATKLSVPLPNFDTERFSEAVFQPTPRGFSRQEPAFSEKAAVASRKPAMRQAAETATEIVKVSSKDQNLFDSDYNYEDYYYDQINAQTS